jgi:hypothetical protein
MPCKVLVPWAIRHHTQRLFDDATSSNLTDPFDSIFSWKHFTAGAY